jgi:hypothetical protein
MNPYLKTFKGMPWIDRDLEKRLLNSYVHKTLHKGFWIQGLRQVGKTELLTKFGTENFRKFYRIDLLDDEKRAILENEIRKTFTVLGGTDYDKMYASASFKNCLPGFQDSPDEFVLIDEIQASEYIYNRARGIVKGLDAKVAFSGSFLGDVVNWEKYNDPVGDVIEYELRSITYKEFIGSLAGAEEYRKFKRFTRNVTSLEDRKILQSVQDYWNNYALLGGFPEPLTASLVSSLNEALLIRDADLNKYVRTLTAKTDKKAKEILGESLTYEDWMRVLGWVTDTVLRGYNPARLGNVTLEPKKNEFPITINSAFSHYLIQWLTGSMVLTHLPIVDDLIYPETFIFRKLVFTNYAILCKFAEELNVSRDANSIIKGVRAESFVYNELYALKNLMKFVTYPITKYNLKDADGSEEVDFVFTTKEGARILVEVKNTSGETISSNKVLARGEADYMIKIQKKTASIEDNVFKIPMYNIDKLADIIHIIDQAHLENMSVEKSYEDYVSRDESE